MKILQQKQIFHAAQQKDIQDENPRKIFKKKIPRIEIQEQELKKRVENENSRRAFKEEMQTKGILFVRVYI